MNARQFVEEVSRYLQDNEFEDDVQYVHWTEDDLFTYFRLALSITSMVRSEEFVQTVDVELVEGAIQTLPHPCKSLKAMQGQKNDRGVITNKLREAKITHLASFKRALCLSASSMRKGAYEAKTFSYDYDDPKTIYVDPPVPRGAKGTLTLVCYAPPDIKDIDEELDIDENVRPIIFELMLYYAYGVDIEDSGTRERSEQHWAKAMTLLQVYDYKQQEELRNLYRRGING